jgi:hypothetical protein
MAGRVLIRAIMMGTNMPTMATGTSSHHSNGGVMSSPDWWMAIRLKKYARLPASPASQLVFLNNKKTSGIKIRVIGT